MWEKIHLLLFYHKHRAWFLGTCLNLLLGNANQSVGDESGFQVIWTQHELTKHSGKCWTPKGSKESKPGSHLISLYSLPIPCPLWLVRIPAGKRLKGMNSGEFNQRTIYRVESNEGIHSVRSVKCPETSIRRGLCYLNPERALAVEQEPPTWMCGLK